MVKPLRAPITRVAEAICSSSSWWWWSGEESTIGRFTTRATRTEAIRVLLVEGLRKRALLK